MELLLSYLLLAVLTILLGVRAFFGRALRRRLLGATSKRAPLQAPARVPARRGERITG